MARSSKTNKSLDAIVIDPILEEKVRKENPYLVYTLIIKHVKNTYRVLIRRKDGLDAKAKERISENMHILANEPSLAYYRLQENIRKSLPHLVEKRIEAEKLQKDLQGNIYDLEYAISELSAMEKTQETFKNILELTKNALFLKQQVKYLKTKRNKKDPSSVYKRFSAHITIDLPDLPDALKETANKVESMMGNSRHSTMY